MAKILITGATGHFGTATIGFLLKKGVAANDIAALVRNEAISGELKAKGIAVKIGNYHDYPALKKAFQGVETVFLISSSDMENRVEQHSNVVKAAKEAGVTHLFYTSYLHADKLLNDVGTDHLATEQAIKNSSLHYTIFRNTYYSELLPMFLGNATEIGVWDFPSEGKKVNFVSRTEIAEGVANALITLEQHKNKTYEITSGKAFTLQEIAQSVSEITGKNIVYNDLPVEDFGKKLKEANLPEALITMNVKIAQSFINGAFDFTEDALGKLLGREPEDIPAYLAKVLKK